MVQIDLGERLIRLADKVLSKNSNETIGHTGGITNATANDTYIPTTKAVKEYVDDRFNIIAQLPRLDAKMTMGAMEDSSARCR